MSDELQYDYWKPFIEQILKSGKHAKSIDLVSLSDQYLMSEQILRAPSDAVELPWWPLMSKALGGLRANEFSILCGPTGSGKTSLLCGIATQLLEANVSTFVAAVETGRHDFYKRILSALINKNLVTGRATQEDLAKIKSLEDVLLSERVIFTRYENRINHKRLLADMLYAHEQYNCKVMLLDNVNFFMEIGDAKSQVLLMDQTIHDFVVFCKQVKIHVILVMHPRKGNDTNRVTNEFDIKGSSTAVQEASNVIFWNRLEDDEHAQMYIEPPLCRELSFGKIRVKGENVKNKIYFHLRNQRLEEYAIK